MGLKKAYDELEITDGRLELNGNDVTNVGAMDVDSLNTADLANAGSETIPTAQGDGTLSMSGLPEGNGPFMVHAESFQGTDELPVTINFTDPVDYVEVFHATDTSGVEMQMNGLTDEIYSYDNLASGASTTGAVSAEVLRSTNTNWQNEGYLQLLARSNIASTESTPYFALPGARRAYSGNIDANGPIDSLKFFDDGGSDRRYQYTVVSYELT